MELLTCINKNEVLKYLGCRGGEIDSAAKRKIDEMADLVKKTAGPKACHTVLRIINHEPLLFERTEAQFLGQDIKKHLAESEKCILMAATLGGEIDSAIRRMMIKNMADAVVFDACASSAIENVCDNYCRELEERFGAEGLFLTDRFSPGYGDMPISCQKDFMEILQTSKRMGLFLNRSMMMEPTKSVTAAIGAAKTPQAKRRAGCESCGRFSDCEFRRRGVRCYE